LELKYYFRVFRKWLWLIAIISIIIGVSGYLLAPTRYQARVLIAVGGDYIRSPSPDRNEVLTGIQLAETYAVIAKTPDVLRPAAAANGLDLSTVDEAIQARILPNTSILAIQATHENPTVATNLANEIADQLIARSRYLEIIEWAQTPTDPQSPTRTEMAIILAIISGSLVSFAVLLRDYLDESFSDAEEVKQALSVPVVGTIKKYSRPKGGRSHEVEYILQDESLREQFRSLRTNILVGRNQKRKHILVITSTSPNEGKTVVASSLGAELARVNINVLLVDSDLHRPALHTYMGLHNDVGLVHLLEANPPQPDPTRKLLDIDPGVSKVVQFTDNPRLRVITSGGMVNEPAALLGSQNMRKWIQALLAASDVDFIVLDTAPALAAADVFDMASQIDAAIYLVVEAGKTQKDFAVKFKERCNYLDLDFRGVILNRVTDKSSVPYTYSAKPVSRVGAFQNKVRSLLSNGKAEEPRPKKVLLVEDDHGIQTMLKEFLSKEDYEINIASTGEEGFNLALEWKPDLILLDVMLPDTNGYVICRRLKAAKPTAKVPIIFVTARMSLEDQKEGFESGGIDYIIKPFRPSELLLRVEAHLRDNHAYYAHENGQ